MSLSGRPYEKANIRNNVCRPGVGHLPRIGLARGPLEDEGLPAASPPSVFAMRRSAPLCLLTAVGDAVTWGSLRFIGIGTCVTGRFISGYCTLSMVSELALRLFTNINATSISEQSDIESRQAAQDRMHDSGDGVVNRPATRTICVRISE